MRRKVFWALIAVLLVVSGCAGGADQGGMAATADPAPAGVPSARTPRHTSPPLPPPATTTAAPTATAAPTTAVSSAPPASTWAPPAPLPRLASSETALERVDIITGDITPKSVWASGKGLVMANNMLYAHSMTLYDAATRSLIRTIDDSVVLSDYGIDGHAGVSRGAPVENVWTADGRYAYVTNYALFGEGWPNPGKDKCSPADGFDHSVVYRVEAATGEIDQVIQVGSVPKFLALTPDEERLVVSNWCDWTVSVIDVASGETQLVVPVGANPRGIVVSPDGETAFVAAMNTRHIYAVDLRTGSARIWASPGIGMRHLVLSPDGKTMYAVASAANTVSALDVATGRILDVVNPGNEPRSMAISADGSALYVCAYDDHRVVKIRTEDLEIVDSAPTDYKPIGVTFEPVTNTVWVASYSGSIMVFADDRTRAQIEADPLPPVEFPVMDYSKHPEVAPTQGWTPPPADAP